MGRSYLSPFTYILMPQIVKFQMPSGDFTKLLDAPSEAERARILDVFRREGSHIQPEPWSRSQSERSKMMPQGTIKRSITGQMADLQSSISSNQRIIDSIKNNPTGAIPERPEALQGTIAGLEFQKEKAHARLQTLMHSQGVKRLRKTASISQLIAYLN